MRHVDGTMPANWKFSWNSNHKEIVEIEIGEEVRIDIPDSSSLQIQEDWTHKDLDKIDWNRVDSLVGPVKVNGIQKGETVRIDIIDLSVGKWGWSAILRDFGFLKNRYEQTLVIWDIGKESASARDGFLDGIKIPLRPMIGILGTMPAEGEFPVIPPQSFGGNLDNKYLRKGASIYLPSGKEGAMFAISDPHASQGNGEVCGTGIETSATATLSVSKSKHSFNFPVLESHNFENDDVVVFTAIASDMHEALHLALTNFISAAERSGMDPREAYVLASVAGDFEIAEAVDEPNLEVSLKISKDLFFFN